MLQSCILPWPTFLNARLAGLAFIGSKTDNTREGTTPFTAFSIFRRVPVEHRPSSRHRYFGNSRSFPQNVADHVAGLNLPKRRSSTCGTDRMEHCCSSVFIAETACSCAKHVAVAEDARVLTHLFYFSDSLCAPLFSLVVQNILPSCRDQCHAEESTDTRASASEL
jgi:hypothetical protein